MGRAITASNKEPNVETDAAYRALYDTAYRDVLAYCRRRSNSADAHDAAAEVFTIAAAKQRFHRAKGRLAREFKRLGEKAMSDTKQRPINTDRPLVKQERTRGLLYGAAAAVIVLVLGTAAWIALAGSGATLEAAAEGGDPVAVIEVFYQKWSEGDVDGAMEFVSTNQRTFFLRSTMEYVVALEPAGWSWSVSDCAEQIPGTYRCRLELVGDPVIDAMGLEAGLPQLRVSGNRLIEVADPAYAQADQKLAVYAETQDPEGYEAVCTEGNGLALDGQGVVYDQACGAFLAPYVPRLAAELTGP